MTKYLLSHIKENCLYPSDEEPLEGLELIGECTGNTHITGMS